MEKESLSLDKSKIVKIWNAIKRIVEIIIAIVCGTSVADLLNL